MSQISQQVLFDERQYLIKLLRQLKPSELSKATLCEGWDVADLAAHLVVREHGGILARFGIVLPFLQRYHDRAIAKQKAVGIDGTIAKLHHIPWWGTHLRFNIIEFYVHNEDILRGGLKRQRQLSPELETELSRLAPGLIKLRLAGLDKRLAITTIDSRTDDVLWKQPTTDNREPIILTALPGEFILLTMGRGRQASISIEGSAAAKDWYKTSVANL